MKKETYKKNLKETKKLNATMQTLLEILMAEKTNSISEQNLSTEENNLDFLEKNARESNLIEVLKNPSLSEKAIKDYDMKELQTELKMMSQKLKKIEKRQTQHDNCLKDNKEKLYKHTTQIDSLQKAQRTLEKKQKKEKSDLKIIKQFFSLIGYQHKIFMPGAPLKQVVKSLCQSITKNQKTTISIQDLVDWRDEN